MKAQTQSVFAALADPTREAIVRLLIDQESSVGDIADRLPVSRPAVSKHLRLLQGAGIVNMRSEGTRNVYTLDPAALELVRNELDVMWRRALARFALVANSSSAALRQRKNAPR